MGNNTKMKYTFNIAAIILITLIIGCSNSKQMVNNNTVNTLELNKFLGTWYEIARYPHSFEKNLVGVTATYSMKEDGNIKVLNQGHKFTLDGKLSSAIGKAKIPDLQNPAHLRVSFFWIFYSDYLVLELDEEDYSWAVIGSSSPNYLWILSRTPQLEKETLDNLKLKIQERGYDLEKLIMVDQPME